MLFPARYAQELPQEKYLHLLRVCSPISLIGLVLVTITYSFGVTRPNIQTISEVSSHLRTSFTPNAIMTFDVFVGIMYCTQFTYLVMLLSTNNEALLISATMGVSYHFVLFCILQCAQLALFVKKLFAVAEVLLIANLVNLLLLYIRLGPTPHRNSILKNIYLQIPLVKMPLALTIL